MNLRINVAAYARLIAIGFLATINQSVTAQSISFNDSLNWEQVKAKARAEDKYIFIDVMATWCGPCKAMEQSVYTNPAVAQYFNDHFINVKVQTDKTAGDAPAVKAWYQSAEELAAMYKVNALPSMIFLTPGAQLASKVIGYREADTLLTDAKQSMEESTQYCYQLAQYVNGKRDTDFIEMLAARAEQMGRTVMARQIRGGDPFAQYLPKACTPPVAMAGEWEIDYAKREFGELPRYTGAKQITINVTLKDITIARLTTNKNDETITNTETIRLDGSYANNVVKTRNRIRRSRIAPAGGNFFTELSQYTFPDSRTEIEFTAIEEWQSAEDGKTLTIRRTVDDGQQPYTITLLYNKK